MQIMPTQTGKKGKIKMSTELQFAVSHWPYFAPLVSCPKSEGDYKHLIAKLDELLDVVGGDEKHPLISLVDLMSNAIAVYEEQHINVAGAKGIDALKYLLAAHSLRQSDLKEIGSQGVVSEILQGKRKLNLRQIKKLAQRFKVSPETFID